MSLTERQIATRYRGVGGSEMLAALGKDPRTTRLELYMRKVGELPEPDFDDNERVRFGTLLEPVIRKEYERRLGEKILSRRVTLVHPKLPIVASPDGWIPALEEGVEIKTADKFEAQEFGEQDSDQIPVRYVVQCATYMIVKPNAKRWRLVVLIGGNDLRTYTVERDPQLEDAIVTGAQEFWSHVEQRRPPDPQTPDDVKIRWPKDLGLTVTATPEISDLCAQLAVADVDLKVAEQKRDGLKMEVQKFMAEASELVGPDGKRLATWRTAKSSMKFDTKRFSEEHPAIYADYQREQPGSRRFLLK